MTPKPAKQLRPIAIILWLIFFFPVGLWFLWCDPRPPLRLKQAVTGIIAAIILVNMIYENSPAGRAAQTAQNRSVAIAAAQQKAADAEQAKQEAQKAAALTRAKKCEAEKMATYAGDYRASLQILKASVPEVASVGSYDPAYPNQMFVTLRGDRSDYQSRKDALSVYNLFVQIRHRYFDPVAAADCIVTISDDTGKTIATATKYGADN